jgi:hypothetical protein
LISSLFGSAQAELLLSAEPGTSTEIVSEVQRAIDEYNALLKENLGLAIEDDVRVIISPSKESYATLLHGIGGQNYEEAKLASEVTGGMFIHNRHLVLLYLKDNAWIGRLRFVLAHELTHALQLQLSKSEKPPRWLNEGMADWFGSLLSQRMGTKVMDTWKDELLDTLSSSRSMLKPGEIARANLNDWNLWNKQKRRPYELSDLMMLKLAERQEGKIFTNLVGYYRCLNGFSFESTCFSEHFGLKENDFYQDFQSFLASEIAGT